MNRRLTPRATHLAALAIGWSIYQFAPTDLKSTAAIASASRTRPDPRQAELAEGRRVLDEMRRFWPSPVKADVLAAARYDPVGFEAEMVYARRGLSFYYRSEDPGSRIFSIHASSPFKLRTGAGITLGKSTMADVLKSYGKLDWSTTKDSDYWWSEHDGVRYSVLRDKSVPQFPLNEELHLDHLIITIGVNDRH